MDDCSYNALNPAFTVVSVLSVNISFPICAVIVSSLYNQIVAESYFPHLYGRSENLRAAKVKSKIIPLPQNPDEILNFTEPLKTYNDTIEKSNMKENESNDVIKKLNSKFDLNL